MTNDRLEMVSERQLRAGDLLHAVSGELNIRAGKAARGVKLLIQAGKERLGLGGCAAQAQSF